MVIKILSFIFLFFLAGFSSPAQDITGSWSWNSDDGGDVFTLNLVQISEDNYRGNHCGVFMHGNRQDCSENREEYSVALIRKSENFFQGSIRSGLSFTAGNVQLQYVPLDDTMLFSLKTHPEGEFYIPVEGRLQRN